MVIPSEAQRSRRIPQITPWASLRGFSTSLGIAAMPISTLAAEEFHDIAPPVDYSLISPWLVFLGVFVSLTVIGLIVWFVARSLRHPTPPQLPRERALGLLEPAVALKLMASGETASDALGVGGGVVVVEPLVLELPTVSVLEIKPGPPAAT